MPKLKLYIAATLDSYIAAMMYPGHSGSGLTLYIAG